MTIPFAEKLLELLATRQPYVLATVVHSERPASARAGDKAIVIADGTVYGWIGGSCAQPIVVREAQRALQSGQPQLLKIGSEQATKFGGQAGVQLFEMTCFSGGAMEIFIEPVLPKHRLVVAGCSPDMLALVRLAQILQFDILLVDPEVRENDLPEGVAYEKSVDLTNIAGDERTWIVVGTHGRFDEEALEQALRTKARYIGLVASTKRAASLLDSLKAQKFSGAQLARIKSPAGLDIGAKSPEEIALSILTEIVALARQQAPEPEAEPKPDIAATPGNGKAIDPICGMTVDITTARHKAEYAGKTYYFCCADCRQKFEQEPEKYLDRYR